MPGWVSWPATPEGAVMGQQHSCDGQIEGCNALLTQAQLSRRKLLTLAAEVGLPAHHNSMRLNSETLPQK